MPESPAEGANITLTADIVSAFVSNNPVSLAELPGLIATVHAALSSSDRPPATAQPASERASAAQIRKSIGEEHLVSFLDGKPYLSLKRHAAKHGLDADGYRARFGLPSDYPMVSAGYSARRSELAKRFGLGRKSVGGAPAESASPAKSADAKADQAPTARAAPKGRAKAISPDEETFT